MRVSQLFSIFSQYYLGENPTQEVELITTDSRQVHDRSVFIAIRGTKSDGHQFLKDVLSKNPAGVVVEKGHARPGTFQGAWVEVDDTRKAQALIAAHFYGRPAQTLFCIGVTGTNGKTTTTHMIEHLLNKFGWPTGVLGTINHHLLEHVWETDLTTPDAISLQQRLRQMKDLGAKAVAFEVSSIALHQFRADHVPYDCVVFTNFTRDHLDYHGSMEEYFKAKQRLFNDILLQDQKKESCAILNGDDPWAAKMQIAPRAHVYFYGQANGQSPFQFQFQVNNQDFTGTQFHLKSPQGEFDFFIPVPGLYNVSNAVAAIATCAFAGMSMEKMKTAFATFQGVPGRMQRVPNPSKERGPYVFVDYAHTPDALSTVLKTLTEIRKNSKTDSRIITVFGCGGDRDKGKRPLMAQMAAQFSDQVVVTSDNPRTEVPSEIIQDILNGMPEHKAKTHTELDRRLAIRWAVENARSQDVVLIAGKGHENYQIVGTQKLPFNDFETALEFLK